MGEDERVIIGSPKAAAAAYWPEFEWVTRSCTGFGDGSWMCEKYAILKTGNERIGVRIGKEEGGPNDRRPGAILA